MNPPNVWCEDCCVRNSEINRKGQLTLEALLDFLEGAAGNHAERLGCGFDALRQYNQAWVVSRVQLEILRTPVFGEKILVKTWPRGFRRIIANRHTCLCSNTDELVHASSFWALIDLASGRPLPLPDSLRVPLPDNDAQPEYFAMPAKLVEKTVGHDMVVPVTERLLDRNGHVNNCRYAGLVTDWLGRELGQPADISGFTANYLSPTPPGDTLTVAGIIDGREFHVEIAGTERKRFAASGLLRP